MKAMTNENGIALDPLTAKLFKRQRKTRVLSSCPSTMDQIVNKSKNSATEKNQKKMSEQDRGRIRRLKQKVWLLLKRKSNFKL